MVLRIRSLLSIRVLVPVAALAVAAGLAPASAAAPPGASAAGEWTPVFQAAVGSQWATLTDSASVGTQSWHVGYRDISLPGATERRNRAVHCEGTTCSFADPRDVENPPFNTRNVLTSVAAGKDGSVWAAGYAQRPSTTGQSARLFQWDGAAWVESTPPTGAGALVDVAVSPNGVVWVTDGALTYRLQNGRWFTVGSLVPECRAPQYVRLAVNGPTQLAVVRCPDGLARIMQLFNGSWRLVAHDPLGVEAEQASISWVGRRAWTSGTGLLARDNGPSTPWVAAGPRLTSPTVFGVAAGSRADRVWVLGVTTGTGTPQHRTYRRAGTWWTSEPYTPIGTFNSLTVLSDGTVLATGNNGAAALVARYTGAIPR